MRIKQLGNGGAFDTGSTNSSFLIDSSGDYILFDCGYNVFSKLRELDKTEPNTIEKINTIFISHLDDDHVGSLKSLLHYRFYILNKTTTVVSGVSEVKDFIKDVNFTMKFNQMVPESICEFKLIGNSDLYYLPTNNSSTRLAVVDTFHRMSCRGLYIYDNKNTIYISGDTKVCESTIKIIDKLHKLYTNRLGYLRIYHDFSNWNNYENNPHTCEYDFEKYYKDKPYYKNIIKYHNNECFDNSWVELGR